MRSPKTNHPQENWLSLKTQLIGDSQVMWIYSRFLFEKEVFGILLFLFLIERDGLAAAFGTSFFEQKAAVNIQQLPGIARFNWVFQGIASFFLGMVGLGEPLLH